MSSGCGGGCLVFDTYVIFFDVSLGDRFREMVKCIIKILSPGRKREIARE